MGIVGDKPHQLAPTGGTTGVGSMGSPVPSPLHQCCNRSIDNIFDSIEGFRSIENKKIPTKTNKNSQDLIYEMQNNERD
jgi:hypothetical protein